MKKAIITGALVAIALIYNTSGGATNLPTTSAARLDPLLISYLSARAPSVRIPAVTTYRNRPGTAELNRLRSLGIVKGFALRELPMVITDLSLVQANAVKTQPGVVSI